MCRILFSLIAILIYLNISSQKIDLIDDIGEGANIKASDFKINTFGSIYLVGNYYGTVLFDTVTLSTSSSSSFFIANYKTGQLNWVKQIKGESNYNDTKLGVDGEDNVYLTGTFHTSILFDSLKFISKGSNDIFMAKYSSSGECLWAKQIGGDLSDLSGNIDIFGNVYLTGTFRGTVMLEDSILGNSPGSQLFFAKFNKNGNFYWFKTIESIKRGHEIIIDSLQNIYIAGEEEDWKIFIAKYDSSGQAIWSKHIQTGAFGKASYIAVDSSSNVYCIGSFFNFASFDSKTIESGELNETFLVKYDQDGNEQWVKNYNLETSSDYFEFTDLCIDNEYIYTSAIIAGNLNIEGEKYSDNSSTDALILCYQHDGDLISHLQLKGNSTIEPVGIECNLGRLFIAGNYINSIDLGTFSISSDTYNSFIIQLDQNDLEIYNKTSINYNINQISIKNNSSYLRIQNINGNRNYYQIYNVKGTPLTNNLRLGSDEININHLKNGIYFVKIQSDNYYTIKKFIKI